MNYSRTWSSLQRKTKLTFSYKFESEVYGAILIGITIGLVAFIGYTAMHNLDKGTIAKYQQLTANPPHQVEVQGTVDGKLIQ